MRDYTCDWFVCGLCGAKSQDIEHYVSHMVLAERCIMHLCPSSAITDLLLPRFSKKQNRVEGEEVDIKHAQDLMAIISEGAVEGMETDVKEGVAASEVETGEGQRRWKCRLCALTFSRQAAVLNHFKLQHTESNNPEEKDEATPESLVKKETQVDHLPPIKHILAIESKPPQVPFLDKTWNQLACHICGQIFKTSKIVRTHLATVHSGGRPFTCPHPGCPYTFKTKGSLTRHTRRHTGERPFSCPDCGRCFRESGSLARHQKSRGFCVNKTDAQIPRYGTSLPFASHEPTERKPPVNDHHPACHLKLKQESVGSQADEASRDWLNEETKAPFKTLPVTPAVKVEPPHHHPYSLPPSSTPLIPCKLEAPPAPPSLPKGEEEEADNTNEMPDESKDIKPPQEPLHSPGIIRRTFTCPLCGQTYTARTTLTTHMKLHLDQLGDSCGECGKTFTSRGALSRHLSCHSSLRQYWCGLCGKGYKLASHARAHLTTHTHTSPIPCTHCGRLYKTKSARNIHERTHRIGCSFRCQECPRAFSTKASLVRHLRTHTGEAPFSCQYCLRTFKEHGTLSRHLKNKMPCAGQAVLEAETGDLGIRLITSVSEREVKVEELHQDSSPPPSTTTLLYSPTSTISEPYNTLPSPALSSSARSSYCDLDPDDPPTLTPTLALGEEEVEEEGPKTENGQNSVVLEAEGAAYIIISNQNLGTFSLVSER